MGTQIGITGAITDSSTTRQYALGTEVSIGGKSYRYIEVDAGSSTLANGSLVYSMATGRNLVTDDISDTKNSLWRGVAVGAIASGSFGWVQYAGPHSAAKVEGSGLAGSIATFDGIKGSLTADGCCAAVTAGVALSESAGIIGHATGASISANTVALFLEGASENL